jgi:hypothetical protein
MKVLRIPQTIRVGGEVNSQIPVGKEGVWEFFQAVVEGHPAQIQVAAHQESLEDLAEALGILHRACELAAAVGRQPSVVALAGAVGDVAKVSVKAACSVCSGMDPECESLPFGGHKRSCPLALDVGPPRPDREGRPKSGAAPDTGATSWC